MKCINYGHKSPIFRQNWSHRLVGPLLPVTAYESLMIGAADVSLANQSISLHWLPQLVEGGGCVTSAWPISSKQKTLVFT